MKDFYKRNIIFIVCTIACFISLCGCNKEPVFIDVDTKGIADEIMIPETLASEGNSDADTRIDDLKETVTAVEYEVTEAADTEEYIKVHVCGAVGYPGVYELVYGSRVIDGVNQAGGLLPQAAADYVNLAAIVSDGDKIWIPTVEEIETFLTEGQEVPYVTSSKAGAGLGMDTFSNSPAKININTADKELLCTLPGIGSTRADSIISYREQNGNFSTIEDIMKVSGIKDSSFQKIKEYISVK